MKGAIAGLESRQSEEFDLLSRRCQRVEPAAQQRELVGGLDPPLPG